MNKRIIALFLFMLCFILTAIDASAITTGFETEAKEDGKDALDKREFVKFTSEPEKRTVHSFDVNPKGLIAIATEPSSDRGIVCIYSSEGEFQYGYSFMGYGNYDVEWDGDNLNIYFVRSDMLISVAPSGDILDTVTVKDTTENNSYRNYFLHKTERRVDNTEYILRNDMGVFNYLASSYSQVVVKDLNGDERIVYDVNSTQMFTTVSIWVGGLLLFAIAFAIILRNMLKANRNTQ